MLTDEQIDALEGEALSDAVVRHVPGRWSNRFPLPSLNPRHARHMEGTVICDDRLRGPYISALASLMGWTEPVTWQHCHGARVPPEYKCRAALRAVRDQQRGQAE